MFLRILKPLFPHSYPPSQSSSVFLCSLPEKFTLVDVMVGLLSARPRYFLIYLLTLQKDAYGQDCKARGRMGWEQNPDL